MFYFAEEDNEFVRFHAVQSIVVFGSISVVLWLVIPLLEFVAGQIPFVGPILGIVLSFTAMAVWLGTIALWVILMIKAFQGNQFELPVAGDLAHDYS